MTGNIFLRTGMLFLLCGITLGLYMGIKEDFTFAPAHAHLNLVGGVWMFLIGLFYNAHPHLSRKAIAVHYGLNVVAVPIFFAGIAGAQIHAAWYGPVVGIGSILAAASFIFFTVMVFIGTGKKNA
jgi:hypothetical protein